jgi:hypothetical protein
MNIKEFSRKLEVIANTHKIDPGVGLRFGNDFVDLVMEKSDNEARDAAKQKLDLFLSEANFGPAAEVDIREAIDACGLKNTNADRQWMRHQVERRRLTYVSPENAAAAD